MIRNLPIGLTWLDGDDEYGVFSSVTKGLLLLSLRMSWKYRKTATPSPQLCSKFIHAVPSDAKIRLNDLSNHLKEYFKIYG